MATKVTRFEVDSDWREARFILTVSRSHAKQIEAEAIVRWLTPKEEN